MQTTKTIDVPHLGGSQIGYCFGAEYNPGLPTLVLVNSFTTSAELYKDQFEDRTLAGKANLLAVEPYGHGLTRTTRPTFTFWDAAIANMQVLEKLGISSAFALGTSQGGFIVARMALLEPDKIKGIIPCGVSFDYDSAESKRLGNWVVEDFCNPIIDSLADEVGPNWAPPDDYCNGLIDSSLGPKVSDAARSFWTAKIKESYKGDGGRQRLRMCAINLRDRDRLLGRLAYIECPVLWLHGSGDAVFSVPNARRELEFFSKSKKAELKIIEGGHHFLSATNPAEVNALTLDFITKWN
jgi:pimeloyl-ACP methyl ester carboxylesterase